MKQGPGVYFKFFLVFLQYSFDLQNQFCFEVQTESRLNIQSSIIIKRLVHAFHVEKYYVAFLKTFLVIIFGYFLTNERDTRLQIFLLLFFMSKNAIIKRNFVPSA